MPRLLSNVSPKKSSKKEKRELQDLEEKVKDIMRGGKRDYYLWKLKVASGNKKEAEKYYEIMKKNKLMRDEEKFWTR